MLYTSLQIAKETHRLHSNVLASIRRLQKTDPYEYTYTKDKYYTERENKQEAVYYKVNKQVYNTMINKINRWDIDKITTYIIKNNLPVRCLSKTYNAKELKWQCIKDGYIWYTPWTTIKSGESNCSRCSQQEHWSQKRILEKLAHPFYANIQLLSTEYIDSYTPLKCKCKICGKIWQPLWSNMYHRKQGCSRCNGVEDMSCDLLTYKLKLPQYNSWRVKVIPNKITAHTKLTFICKKCGYKRHISWNTLQHNSNCSSCNPCPKAPYNILSAENNKILWEKRPVEVYFLKMYNNTEQFYKIGIASKGVNHRYSSLKNYKYKILKILKTNKYEAVYLEKALHIIHAKYTYQPNLHFAGHTECFATLIPYTKEALQSTIDDLKKT